jgi:antitoxin component YwqK of YwqJK toxin-antitoxin module
MIRIDINDSNFVLRDTPTNWGGGFWYYNGIPFTGITYEYYPNTTQLSSESEFKNGILDGRQLEYWPNGQIKVEFFQMFDYHHGSFKEWNAQGELISHQEFDEFGNWVKTIL